MTNANRSKLLMEQLGYICWVVEARLPIPGMYVSRDMFNLVDVFCVDDTGRGNIGVQSTSRNCVKEHMDKYATDSMLMKWLLSGERFCIHGWEKKNGKFQVRTWVARLRGNIVIWDEPETHTWMPRVLDAQGRI